MPELLDRLSGDARAAVRKARHPDWTAPMLATLKHDVFSDPDWIYERKLDGVRCLAFRNGKSVRLLTRNQRDENGTYPEIVEALGRQPVTDFVLDGEVVAFENGVTSFARLQRRMQIRDPDAARASGITVFFYVFDLLHVQGYDVARLALRDRKALLREAVRFEDPLRFTPHRNARGERYFEEACRKGWEGLIAKRAASKYVHKRSADWLKLKCVNRQEFVIGGYTEPRGSRIGFGALLLGYYENGDLRYAGRVGTGYDNALLERLGARLEKLERDGPPFVDAGSRRKGVHWVAPRLVAEVGFTEWTGDGRLRHPRFVGLRTDKRPRDVVRERPKR